MGFVLAMFMNAIDYREFDCAKNTMLKSTRLALKVTFIYNKKDFKKMCGTAKLFAIFRFFFSDFECQIEKVNNIYDIS